jgi:hypothetical protein
MRRGRFGVAWALGAGLAVVACTADPAATPTKAYLQQAQAAVAQRNSAEALAALDRAQSFWVSRNVPFTTPFFTYDPTALTAMARARQSVEMGRWDDARYYVSEALDDPSILTP